MAKIKRCKESIGFFTFNEGKHTLLLPCELPAGHKGKHRRSNWTTEIYVDGDFNQVRHYYVEWDSSYGT